MKYVSSVEDYVFKYPVRTILYNKNILWARQQDEVKISYREWVQNYVKSEVLKVIRGFNNTDTEKLKQDMKDIEQSNYPDTLELLYILYDKLLKFIYKDEPLPTFFNLRL